MQVVVVWYVVAFGRYRNHPISQSQSVKNRILKNQKSCCGASNFEITRGL